MYIAAWVVSVLLLAETVPSALAGLTRMRAGIVRLDGLTGLGLAQGRRLWVVSLLGAVHALGSAAVFAGLWRPGWGIAGAGLEAAVFCWVLTRQTALGARGRSLTAYSLFLLTALAVLAVDAAR